jgi:hypothetical protein
VGFQPIYLLIYPQVNGGALCCQAQKSDKDGLNTDVISNNAADNDTERHYEADQIISLDADGFTVGDGTGDWAAGNLLNIALRIYTYVAISDRTNFATGSYVGDGAATQAIAGVGFQPKYVFLYQRGVAEFDATYWFYKTNQDALLTFLFTSGGTGFNYRVDYIISLDINGFTVGDGTGGVANLANILAANYSFICWR